MVLAEIKTVTGSPEVKKGAILEDTVRLISKGPWFKRKRYVVADDAEGKIWVHADNVFGWGEFAQARRAQQLEQITTKHPGAVILEWDKHLVDFQADQLRVFSMREDADLYGSSLWVPAGNSLALVK